MFHAKWWPFCLGSSMLGNSMLTHWPLGDLIVIVKNVIFNLALLICIFKSSYDNVLKWKPHDLTDDKSRLVQVMAWCHKATSHYLNQCWPRSPTPYGITRPQWVNPQIARDAWVFPQHCGYWWPGAKAWGYQYPQCCLNMHCIGLISWRNRGYS